MSVRRDRMKRLTSKNTGIITTFDYYKVRYKIVYLIFLLLLLVTVALAVFPPLWLLLSSFKSAKELYRVPFTLFPERIDFGKVKEVWSQLAFGRYYINSLLVILGAVVCSVMFNGLFAYAVSVIRPAGHQIIYASVLISLMIPPILNMGPLFHNIVKLKLINSYLPLWLVFGANPFYIIMFKTFFDALPKELFEAATIDGASKLQMFRHLVIPLSRPMVVVISIFTINAAWSDFLLPFLVLKDDAKQTVMVKIYALYSSMGTSMHFGPDKLLMVLAFSIIPPILLYIIFQKQITTTIATTGIK